MLTAPVSLEEVGRNAEPGLYPRRALDGCETALILFGAGFHGRQDGYWIAKAGLRATVIDHDPRLLDEMAAVYPPDWEFIEADVYKYVSWMSHPRPASPWVMGPPFGRVVMPTQFDVVSVDCPTGQFEKCAELLPDLCRFAPHAVVLGAGPKHRQEVVAPDGWKVTERLYRSSYEGGVYWVVVEPA